MKIASNYLNFVNSSLLDRLRILAILLSKFKRFNSIPPRNYEKTFVFLMISGGIEISYFT